MDYKIIAVDFDGTLCENKWPEIGEPNWEVINYLKRQKAGGDAKLILWTCRVGEKLTAAVQWCWNVGLAFDTFNGNLPEVIEEFGADTRKVFAHEYIDDRSKNGFTLPFIHNGITDAMILKIEKTFNFRLYLWQVEYLRGVEKAMLSDKARRCGKTFIYIVRLLLEKRPKFDLTELYSGKFVDGSYTQTYTRYFSDEVIEINDKLVEAGFETNLIKEFRTNPIPELYHIHHVEPIAERASDGKWLYARGCAKPFVFALEEDPIKQSEGNTLRSELLSEARKNTTKHATDMIDAIIYSALANSKQEGNVSWDEKKDEDKTEKTE